MSFSVFALCVFILSVCVFVLSVCDCVFVLSVCIYVMCMFTLSVSVHRRKERPGAKASLILRILQ